MLLSKSRAISGLLVLLFSMAAPTWGQLKNQDIPGAVRVDSGIILEGICSATNTLHPRLLPQQLQLRRIDQGFRVYFVHTSHSDPAVEDASVIPVNRFVIQQRGQNGYPMNYEIGLHQLTPFDERGRCVMRLNTGTGQLTEVDLGVTEIDFRQVKLRGLSHSWNVGYGIECIADGQLYSGSQNPGLLKLARPFSSPEAQLNAVLMLIRARKFSAASLLLNDIIQTHPDYKDRADRLVSAWQEQVGLLAVAELERLQLTGRRQLARVRSRNWPEESLSPAIRVRVQDVGETVSEQIRKLDRIKQALGAVLGDVQNVAAQRDARQLHAVLESELDLNNLDRLDAFDLLQDDDSLSPESKLAIAASSLWLGPDNAIENFAEAFGLLQLRYLVIDYCRSEDNDIVTRNRCLEEIRTTEGASPTRIAMLLGTLPPVAARSLTSKDLEVQEFDWTDDSDGSGCRCVVPQEYRTSHRYPLLIALPRAGGDASEVLTYWQQEAIRAGFIVAVPEIRSEEKTYTASAAEHKRFKKVFRRLKSELSIDTDRVFVVGHGMGGSAAMDLATAFPDSFAAVATVAALGRKHLNWTLHNGCHVPWYVVAGTRQPRYYQRIGNILEKLFRPTFRRNAQRYHDVIYARYQERGFEQYVDSRADIFQWLNLQRRGASVDTFESKIVRSSDDAGFWATLNPDLNLRYSLEQGSDPETPLKSTLNLTGYRKGNSYRLTSLPGDAHVLVYLGLEDFDEGEPIRITSVGKRPEIFDFRPNTKDLLDHFREHLDPSRLCLMKIPVDD